MPRWFENVVTGMILFFGCIGLAAPSMLFALQAPGMPFALQAPGMPSHVATSPAVEPESARCFPLPPMCSGRAEPVCICGFYAETCKWVCSERASQ